MDFNGLFGPVIVNSGGIENFRTNGITLACIGFYGFIWTINSSFWVLLKI